MRMGNFIFFILFVFVLSNCKSEKIETLPVEKIAGVKREIFDVKKYPQLKAIGKINFIGKRWCSLTLVSEDIAVSAGHCFLDDFVLSDLSRDYKSNWAVVIFRLNGVEIIQNVYVKRVLKASMNPDYAIVRLNRKVAEIAPLKFAKPTFNEMLLNEASLGCAGFNGDKELGDEGWTMTISRNVKIVPETSDGTRVDTTCFSTYGSSGGLFFQEKINVETNLKEDNFIGVIWGVTDEKFNEKGELVKDENVVTSITPVSVFYRELIEIIGSETKREKL